MVGDGVLDMVLAGEASLGPVDRGAGVGIPVDGPALGGLAGDRLDGQAAVGALVVVQQRSEEHTSELQSLMRISYAVFCLNKKTKINNITLAVFRLIDLDTGHT